MKNDFQTNFVSNIFGASEYFPVLAGIKIEHGWPVN